MQVLGYVRVSTDEQADSRAGIEAQRRAIIAECDRRGWTLVEVIEDAGYSAKDLRRPGIQHALEELKTRRASALVVAKLDRLSRSMLDFAGIMQTAQRQGWALVALDLGVDTSTPSGEMMANVLATFSQFERRLISQRTKEALAVKRSQGVKLGRKPALDPKVRTRIRRLRSRGWSFAKIAEKLNAEGVATAHGGAQWHPSSVRTAIHALRRGA